MPTKHQLPNFELLRKSEKLECLHELAAKVVDEFVFQSSSVVNDIIDSVLTQQEKDDLLQQQELTPEGRFLCRFPGCDKSFSTMERAGEVMNFPMNHQYSLKTNSQP